MKHQFKDNAHCETADMRTVLSFCLPDVANCPNAVKDICRIYRNGDLTNKVAPHRAPIFYDKKGRALNKYETSKAIDNQRNKEGCNYID